MIISRSASFRDGEVVQVFVSTFAPNAGTSPIDTFKHWNGYGVVYAVYANLHACDEL